MIHVSRLIQTSERNPSQWEGLTDDGECVYIRYRWGHLSIGTGKKRLGAVERLNLALLGSKDSRLCVNTMYTFPLFSNLRKTPIEQTYDWFCD